MSEFSNEIEAIFVILKANFMSENILKKTFSEIFIKFEKFRNFTEYFCIFSIYKNISYTGPHKFNNSS